MHRIFAISFVVLFVGLRFLPCSALAQEEKLISAEEFQTSAFAELFQEGEYPAALYALESLLKEYPQDPLLLRYRAMTLDRIGRFEEAINQFQELLVSDPNHIPTRFFLGQAYEHAGQRGRALEEWWWVVRNGKEMEYVSWALTALDQAGKAAPTPPVSPPPPPPMPKRWFLAGIIGWEWDSNVTLKPKDKALANSGDRNSNRYSINLRAGYHLVRDPVWGVDLLYTARQSFHDDSLDDFNFTSQEVGLDARRKTFLWGQELTLGGRYDLAVGFLESNLFSLNHRLTLSADSRLSPHTRTVLTTRLSETNFGPDGSNPPQTSRDGFYGDAGVTQYFYTGDFRRHLFLTQEYNDARTRGGNFERRGTTSWIGFHTPLIGRVQADLAAGFRWNGYPRFSSTSTLETARRRDAVFDAYIGLTYPLTPKLSSRVFYRFVDAKNRNDLFEYDRHIAGVQLLF